MGISANQARLLTLTARQHDLELRAQQISARKMVLANKSQSFALAFSNNLSLIQGNAVSNPDQYIYETLTPYNSKYYTRRTNVVLHKNGSEDITAATLAALNDDAVRAYIDANYRPCTVSYPISTPVTPTVSGNVDTAATNANADAALNGLTSSNIAQIMKNRLVGLGDVTFDFDLVSVQEIQGQTTADGLKTYDVYIRNLTDKNDVNSNWDAHFGVNLSIEGDTLRNYKKGAAIYNYGDENAMTVQFDQNFLHYGDAYITAKEITDFLGITVYADETPSTPVVTPEAQPVYTEISLSDSIQGDVIQVIPGESINTTNIPTYDEAKAEYDANMANLSSIEKMLDMELTQIDTEHKAVKTEYDAVKTLIGDNVEKSFNVFG